MIGLKTITVEIEGTRRLLMHSGRLANKYDPIVKEIASYTKKKSKMTESDDDRVAYLKFKGGMYFDDEMGPFIPSDSLLKTIQEGAAARKQGKDVQAGVQLVDEIGYKLQYQGPRDVDALWSFTDKGGFRSFVDIRLGVVNRGRIPIVRPIFPKGWKVQFDLLLIEESGLTPDDIRAAIDRAGLLKGLGDYRPRYGLFRVTKFEVGK